MAKKARGALRLYKTYVFKDKDPVIDRIRTIVQSEKLSYRDVFLLSGVSQTTIHNWFEGETKRPQYATIAAVTSSMGYKQEFVKSKDVNFAREIEKARAELSK